MPSFTDFIASKSSKEHMKTIPFFVKQNEKIRKPSEGHY